MESPSPWKTKLFATALHPQSENHLFCAVKSAITVKSAEADLRNVVAEQEWVSKSRSTARPVEGTQMKKSA